MNGYVNQMFRRTGSPPGKWAKDGVRASMVNKTAEKIIKDIFPYVSQELYRVLSRIPVSSLKDIEEIRLRAEKPLIVQNYRNDCFVDARGVLTASFSKDVYITTQQDISRTLELMSRNSVYAYQDEIRNGFLTLPGGHRVGLAGRVVLSGNEVRNIKDISGINIRIAREVPGCSNFLVPYLLSGGEVLNTLLISPPQCGKTTMLRDIARIISSGMGTVKGRKVAIIDERSEIAACSKGIPQFDVGLRTDVLDACPKTIGLSLVIRTISPEVIITDELGSLGDSGAVESVMNAGVKIIASAHGYNVTSLKLRSETLKLIESRVFERYVVLSSKCGPGTVEEIIDGITMKPLFRRISHVS